jgi:hypothetical protein
MRKIACYLALIGAILLISCEEESLDPRTNPRFSVTFVQEISSSGVQFGADIYDYGEEEILEYGFVYSQSANSPNLNQDDYVSKQGRPEARFELVANHSMTLGKKYFVSAFLKTPSSLIFSKPVEFVSQGSEGFIVTSVEWPDLIYRDQKLIVNGRRFSKQISNYKLKLGQFDVYPMLVDSNRFEINLPVDLLTRTTGQDLETELRIEINEKAYIEKRLLRFQEPVFEKQAVQKINLNDELTIMGDFLDLGQIDLKIGNQTIQGLTAQKNELKFFLFKETGLKPIVSEPSVTFIIRGISYDLGKIFQLNGPKIVAEKIVLNKDSQLIPVENFDRENLNSNLFFDEDGRRIAFQILKETENGIMVGVFGTPFKSRNFNMQVSSFGVLSESVEVEVVLPVVHIELEGRKFFYSDQDLALISGEKVFVLTNEGVIVETPEKNFQQEKIAQLPVDLSSRHLGIRQSVERGFVFGGGNFNGNFFHDLYYFSLDRLVWERLPDLPESISRFRQVVSRDGFLIFGEPMRGFESFVNERWSLNLQTKLWQRLPDTNQRFWNFQVFYQGADTYMHALEFSSSSNTIYRLKPDYSWEKFIETPKLNHTSIFATPLLINGKYYVFSNRIYTITEIDLNSGSIREYPYPYSFNGRVPVSHSKGIYILPNQNILEDIRLNLF